MDWADDDPIRQGDVIRRRGVDGEAGCWGLIVTADCDIVQNKAGDRLTWLSMVSAQRYLRAYWAPEQLRRLRAKQGRWAVEALGGRLRRAHPGLGPLTAESMFAWLETDDPQSIIDTVSGQEKPDDKLLKVLNALRHAGDHEGSPDPFDRLRETHAMLGRPAADLRASIRDTLAGDGGFPDFFLLPDMRTGEEDGGHVVLLRDITTSAAEDIFASELQARLADRPHEFHRVARLHDRVRFAVAQKLAFLFSRIGLTAAFDMVCADTADLLASAVGLEG